MADKKGFILYFDYKQHFALLTPDEQGRLLMGIFEYAENGTIPELDGAAMMAFSFIRAQLDRDIAKYQETCRRRSEAGKKGGRPQKETESKEKQEEAKKANAFHEKQAKAKKADTDKETEKDTDTDTDTETDNIIIADKPPEKPKRARFVPPTVEEVRAYCRERKNNVDAQQFVDFYESKGWKVGSATMKDWRASVRTWERNGIQRKPYSGQPHAPQINPNDYDNGDQLPF